MTSKSFADIKEQYADDKKLKPEDVAMLEEWQRKQPHLPAPLHPIETMLFLHSCYYSNEAAKHCIDSFYTIRTHCPEIFAKRDPFAQEVRTVLDMCTPMALPELTPDDHMVFYIRLQDRNSSVFNFNATAKTCSMMLELELQQRGCHIGHIGIIDLKGVTLAHLLKCHLVSVKKFAIYLQYAVPFRLKSLHFVNAVPFMDRILALVKPVAKKELQNALYSHFGDNSTIFKFVPKDILPIECGGTKFCATDYYNNVTRKDIEGHSEYFANEESRLVDESKRPPQSRISPEDLFGVEGTFKNLDID